jgi:hypothetical protein
MRLSLTKGLLGYRNPEQFANLFSQLVHMEHYQITHLHFGDKFEQ